jgi:lysophospholipase L1-like esterase
MSTFKPFHTLLFAGAVFGGLALISWLFPKDGIPLGVGPGLKFPTLASVFEPKKEKTDISKILDLSDTAAIDTTALIAVKPLKKDSIAENDTTPNQQHGEIKDPSLKLVTPLEYVNEEKNSLDKFFNALASEINDSRAIHILHYGDSQIEGDRISDFLRLKLQNQFGGQGQGFVSPMPVAPCVALKQTWSENWNRYTAFTGKDKRVKHTSYGAGAGFCRYLGYKTLNDSSEIQQAWLKTVTSKAGGANLASYNKVKLFYGNAQYKTAVEFYENGELKESDTLNIGGVFNVKQFSVTTSPPQFEMKFKGQDSPDIYGLSLEGNGGIMVDNFGLRGSSGTFFNQMNYGQLKSFYDNMNVKLFILQFGGNSLPYIKDKKQCDNFGNYLQAQISTLKKMMPNASFIVIGPADMGVKEETAYVSHPQVENLRNAIRSAAFNTNCAFFDMYACMGGNGSMVSWVDAGIAAKDYIHFSSGGARKIATILYSAIITDYNNYIKKGK